MTFLERDGKMSRKDMIEYITERLSTADDYAVEQVYDFLQEVEY